jgi:hypothetical protein
LLADAFELPDKSDMIKGVMTEDRKDELARAFSLNRYEETPTPVEWAFTALRDLTRALKEGLKPGG